MGEKTAFVCNLMMYPHVDIYTHSAVINNESFGPNVGFCVSCSKDLGSHL